MRIIADDLTGAADAGVFFVRWGAPVTLLLNRTDKVWRAAELGVVSADVATREADDATAAARLSALVREVTHGGALFKKVDSTLRGHLAVEMEVLAGLGSRPMVILAPAFPLAGRTTRGGVQRVDGAPTGSWQDVRGLLGAVRSTHVDLASVRAGRSHLAERLRTARSAAAVVVCDAETDEDLDAVVDAGLLADDEVVWAGAGGLAAALARAGTAPGLLRVGADAARAPMDVVGDERFVVVVGSATSVARRQARAVATELPAELVLVAADRLVHSDATALDGIRADLATRAEARALVVLLSGRALPRRELVRALGFVTGAAASAAPTLVLTGGATARAVLDDIGVGSLALHAELEPGVVLSATSSGQQLITKAGAFGDDQSLVRALRRARGQKVGRGMDGIE